MANRYWVGGSGVWDTTTTTNWSATSGGSGGASAPTQNDSVFFDQAGPYTVTVTDAGTACLDFTVTASNVSFAASAGPNHNIYGNLSLLAGTSWAFTLALQFRATTTGKTIATNGVIMGTTVFNGVGGGWRLLTAYEVSGSRSVSLTNGTIDLDGKTMTANQAFTVNAGTKNLTFNGGTLVCTGAFNNAAPTGFTTTAGTGTGTISMTSATAKTFTGGGSTYNCTLNQGGAGALTVTGNNTFNNITNTTQPASILFTAGTTNIFNNFSLAGTAGNLITIGSDTAATHTLSKSSGIVSSNYLSVSYSIATGGATWYAGANSSNGGNNTGWIFTAPPSPGITGTEGFVLGNGITISA